MFLREKYPPTLNLCFEYFSVLTPQDEKSWAFVLSSASRWGHSKDAEMLEQPTPASCMLSLRNKNFRDDSNSDGKKEGDKNQEC